MSHQCVSPERGLTIQSDSDTYDTLKLVGEGIYGEVTKCRKRSTGRFVALKALKHICCGSTEIRILKLLGKTDADEFHIVRLLEYFHVNARPHLVFELLDQSLLDFHKATDFAPLPVKHIRVIATQLLKALVKLKELSIIHTDLKPDNIMLVNHVQFPFRVKLIDFGSAMSSPRKQEDPGLDETLEPYIQARYYRSPEILLGLPFCEKMDMWSLGCVLSELRLGRPLYPGRNQYEQIMYIVQTQGLPKDYLITHALNMVQLLKRMLSLDPKTRIAPTAALRHQFISLQQLQANHDRTEYYRLSIQGLSAALMYNRAERDEDNQHMLECSHHTSTLDNKSKQTQGNCSRASEHRATDQKDHLAIKHSGRAMSLNMTIGGANLVQNKPFTSHAKNPKHLTHSYQGDCQHISWCVQRNFTESVQGGLTCQPREDQYKVPPQRREDVSFEEVTTLEQEADQGIDIKKDINTNKFSIAVYSLKRSREIQDVSTSQYSSGFSRLEI
uniref:Homeodomain-interacting protein kinase 4-like n=1 Tax=Callorhinchus milii TaxID=7868 RepID=A0A4W3K667_CALMI